MNPGKQSDGSWYVPVVPLRKDELRATAGGSVYRPAKYKQRVGEFQSYLVGWKWPIVTGPCRLFVTLYRPDERRADIDNALSFVMDALNGIAYSDDSLVVEVTARKEYRKGDGGILFRVQPCE